MVDDDKGSLYLKISLVVKRSMIIRKFELRLSNPTALAITTLLSFEILNVSCFFL